MLCSDIIMDGLFRTNDSRWSLIMKNQAEEKTRLFVDKAFDAIITTDIHGVIKSWNPKSEKMFGLSVKEVLGKSIFDNIVPEQRRDLLRTYLDHCTNTGTCIMSGGKLEISFLDCRKREFPAELTLSSALCGGNPVFIFIIRDITDRRQVEEAILLSRKQMEAVAQIGAMANSTLDIIEVLNHILTGTLKAADASAGMIFLRDPETGCLEGGASHGLSEAFVEAFKDQVIKPGEGLTGRIAQTGEAIYIAEDSSHDPRVARSVVKAEGLNSFIGVPVYAEDRIVAVMNIATRPPDVLREEKIVLIKAVGTHAGFAIQNARLFKERRKAEKLLADSEAKYRAAIETSSDGFWINDMEGRILEVNDAYLRQSGYSREELLSMHVNDLEGIEKLEETSEHIQKVMRNGGDIFETRHRRKGGVEWDVEVNVIFWPAVGARIFCFLRDITQRKRDDAINASRLHLMQFAVNHSLDELLEETLNEVEKLTGSPIGFYHFVEDDQKSLTLQNWSARTKTEFCKAEGKGLHYDIARAGVWVDCVYQRKPVIHNDYASLPHRKGMPSGHAEVVRELVVPVIRGKKIRAILGIGNKPADYTKKDVEAVSLLADLAWEIVERKEAERKIIFYQNMLRTLMSKLLVAEEQERRRISEHIHDNISQNLAISKMNLESLQEEFPHAAKELKETQELIEQTIKFIRSLTFELSPPILHELGFIAAVEWFADKVRERYGIIVKFNADSKFKALKGETGILLFRTVKELLNNVIKHSKAKRARVSIQGYGDYMEIKVEDDGAGFDASEINDCLIKGESFGIASIRERISYLNGNFEIHSRPGEGTKVRIIVPLHK